MTNIERYVAGGIAALFLALVVSLACDLPAPKAQSVTLVRVDGGFMSCTTFLSAPPDGGP